MTGAVAGGGAGGVVGAGETWAPVSGAGNALVAAGKTDEVFQLVLNRR